MGRQQSNIEAVRREIIVVRRDLDVLFSELGLLVLSLRQPMAGEGYEQSYLDLAKAKADLDDIEERIQHLQQLGQGIQHSEQRISQLKQLLKKQKAALRVVYGRIGAIAWEEAQSQVLSQTIKHIIPDIGEKKQPIEKIHATMDRNVRPLLKLPAKTRELLMERRLHRHGYPSEELFVTFGQTIAQNHCIRQLASDTATELDEQYAHLSRELVGTQDEIALLQHQIETHKNRLEEAGAGLSSERKIQELRTKKKEAAEEVGKLALSYGKALCAVPDPWKGVNISAEVLRCYDQIRRHERISTDLEQRIAELEIEQEINDLVVLVEQDEERIIHLQETVEQLNRQIAEIRLSIAKKRERIGALKRELISESGEDQ